MSTFTNCITRWSLAASLLGLTVLCQAEPGVHFAALTYDCYAPYADTDTLPDRSLDAQLKAIEKAQEGLQRSLSEKDWNRIESEMENALSRINLDELEIQAKRALAQIDKQKLQMENINLLREVDLEQVSRQIERASAEVSRALAEKNLSKVLQEGRINLKDQLGKAEKELDKAKTTMKNYREMVGSMIREGLIRDKSNYRIRYDKGKLIVDGNELPAARAEKYSRYFSEEHVLITNTNDVFECRQRPLD